MNASRLRCRSVQRSASAYLDGELPARARQDLQQHLRGCTACLASYRATRRLSRVAADLPASEPRPELGRAVVATLAARRSAHLATLDRGAPRRPVGALAAAALAVVALGLGLAAGFGLGRAGAPPPPPGAASEVAQPPPAEPLPSIEPEPAEPRLQPRARQGLKRWPNATLAGDR